MKRTFRKGQKVRSIYDPKHQFVIADSYKPGRLFYEKGTGRWWTASELRAAGAPEKAFTSLKAVGKGKHEKMHPNALRTLLASPLAKAAPKEPPPQKTCELATCGVLFTPKRKWQRFHSYECQKAWHKLRAVAS